MLEKNLRQLSQQEAMHLIRQDLLRVSSDEITVAPVERMSGGSTKMTDIEFEIRGPSFEELTSIANNLVKKMKEAKGYLDVSSSFETGKPQVDILIKREAAEDLKVSPLAIANTLRAAFGGIDVSTFKKGGDLYDIAIRYEEPFRNKLEQIHFVSVKNQQGEMIPLSQLVELRKENGPTQIDRYGRVRQITIFANLNRSEKVLGEAIKEITSLIQKEQIPQGYSFEFTGAATNFKESFGHLVFALFLAIILVYMVLAAQFESFIHPLLIMLSLPLSIVGAIGALVLFNMTMNIYTMIGIIMLMGLVTKNGILLIDFINTLRQEGTLERKEAIIKAGALRLRPILMTTLAVVFGMLPIALGTGAGSESRAPMAMAIIGGLITSTLLTLLVIPVAYELVGVFRDRKRFSSSMILKLIRLRRPSKVKEETVLDEK